MSEQRIEGRRKVLLRRPSNVILYLKMVGMLRCPFFADYHTLNPLLGCFFVSRSIISLYIYIIISVKMRILSRGTPTKDNYYGIFILRIILNYRRLVDFNCTDNRAPASEWKFSGRLDDDCDS